MYYKENILLGIKVDKEDEYLLHMYTFHIDSNGYPKRGDQVHLHKLIRQGKVVDHKNGIKLDCRRDNLRACTHQQNLYNQGKKSNNTSGYKGVRWDKNKWKAEIRIDGEKRSVGRSDHKCWAAFLYDVAAKKHHGEFAELNFDLTL